MKNEDIRVLLEDEALKDENNIVEVVAPLVVAAVASGQIRYKGCTGTC